jgi:hypothetical protein
MALVDALVPKTSSKKNSALEACGSYLAATLNFSQRVPPARYGFPTVSQDR